MLKNYETRQVLFWGTNSDLSMFVKIQLSLSGFYVSTFKCPQELLLKLNISNGIRLIIIGLNEETCANSGLEVVEKIRSNHEFDKIPILTICDCQHSYDNNEFNLFTKGVDLSLKSPLDTLDFIIKVKSLVRRCDLFFDELDKIKNNTDNNLIENNLSIFINEKKVCLTPLEKDIFIYMFKKLGELITTEELLHNVFKYPKGSGNPETIRAHIKNIREKIEINRSFPQILLHIPKKGYILNKNNTRFNFIAENYFKKNIK